MTRFGTWMSLLLVGCGGAASGPTTLAEVEVIRPGVTVGGNPVDVTARVSAGALVATGDGGRAWVRVEATAPDGVRGVLCPEPRIG